MSDPNSLVTKVTLFLIGVLALVCVYISVASAFTKGRQGDVRGSWKVTGSTLISLIPATVAMTVGALAFAAAFLGWGGIGDGLVKLPSAPAPPAASTPPAGQ